MREPELPPTDWPALWAPLSELDGDAWDDEIDRLDGLWKSKYRAALIAHAAKRKWSRQDAEGWSSEIVADALSACRGQLDITPKECAEVDVIECEVEGANAACGPDTITLERDLDAWVEREFGDGTRTPGFWDN
jgi:hypothetical protein